MGLERFTRHALAMGCLLGSMCGAGAPAALLMLPPKLPDVPVRTGDCQAALQLLWWPPVLQARSPRGSSCQCLGGSTSAPPPLKLSLTKSCAATGCTTSWVPWWKVLMKEKRPVKFVMAGANQKHGSLRAGFLCRGRVLSGELWRVGGAPFQREELSLPSGHGFCSSSCQQQGKLCISLSCGAAQEKLWKVRNTVMFLDRCRPFLLCLPSHSCLVLHFWRKGDCTEGCLVSSTAPSYL